MAKFERREIKTEADRLLDRLLETPTTRTARLRRKKVTPELKRAIARLLAEDLDLSPADLAYRARMAVNASMGGKARAAALSPAGAAQLLARPAPRGKEAGDADRLGPDL